LDVLVGELPVRFGGGGLETKLGEIKLSLDNILAV